MKLKRARQQAPKKTSGAVPANAPELAFFHENSPVPYLSFDENAHVVQMNGAAAALLGVSREQFLGMPFPAALHPSQVRSFLEHLHRCRAGFEGQITTSLNLGRDSQTQAPVELSSVVSFVNGERQFPTLIFDLRRSEARLQLLMDARQVAERVFDFVPFPLALLNHNLAIESLNTALRILFRASLDELVGHRFDDLDVVRWQGKEFSHALRRVASHGIAISDLEVEGELSGSGEHLVLVANGIRIIRQLGTSPVILLTFENITVRRSHERKLERMLEETRHLNATLEERVRARTAELAQANDQLRSLSRRVVDAQESERRHLARELHDEIGQQLTGLNMLLHMQENGQLEEREAALRDAQRVVGELLNRVRHLSLDLRPTALDDLGLLMALRSHVQNFSKRTAVPVHLMTEEYQEEILSPQVRTVAFRIVQEALTNVARHAKATHAAITLRTDETHLSVSVADDGKGFNVSKEQSSGGSGLKGMLERVVLAGGQLSIESAPGRGTTVATRLPLRAELEEELK